jgi:hypothetical protein
MLITTTQLWTGLQTAAEGTRQGGIPFYFASFLPLQADNLLTLLGPELHGGNSFVFFGITGLAMALLGMGVKSPHRGAWIATAVLLLMIALGDQTLLFHLLYDFVPGFDRFRRPESFGFEFLVFMARLRHFSPPRWCSVWSRLIGGRGRRVHQVSAFSPPLSGRCRPVMPKNPANPRTFSRQCPPSAYISARGPDHRLPPDASQVS